MQRPGEKMVALLREGSRRWGPEGERGICVVTVLRS